MSWLLRSRRALPSSSRLLRGCRRKIFVPKCSAWPRARSSSASPSCRCSPPASTRLPRRFRRSRTCWSSARASTSSRPARRKIKDCKRGSASCRPASKTSAGSSPPSPTSRPRWPGSTPPARRMRRRQAHGSQTLRARSTRSPASSRDFGRASIASSPTMPRGLRRDSPEPRAGSTHWSRSTRELRRSRSSWSRGRTVRPLQLSPPSFGRSSPLWQPDRLSQIRPIGSRSCPGGSRAPQKVGAKGSTESRRS